MLLVLPHQVELSPPGRRLRRHRRYRTILRLAVIALAIGAIIAWPYAFFYAACLPGAILISAAEGTSTAAAMLLMIPVIIASTAMFLLAAIVPYCALTLAAGRKQCVLYLRKFGLEDARVLISKVITDGLGRRYRVITLDDSAFLPIEVPRFEKRMSRYLFPAIGCQPVAAILLMFGLGIGLWMTNGISLSGAGVIGLLAAMSVFLILPVALPFIGVVAVISSSLLMHRRRVRKRSRVTVDTKDDVWRCCGLVKSMSGWRRSLAFMAPQASVVTTAEDCWQDAVLELSQNVSAVLIDVSSPTFNLAWELRTLLRDDAPPSVLIGDAEKVRSWAAAAETADPMSSPLPEARRLLRDRPVLLYDTSDRRSGRRLKRGLTTILDNASSTRSREIAGPRAVVRGLWGELRQGAWVKVTLTYLCLWIMVASAYSGLAYLGLLYMETNDSGADR